MRPPRGDTPVDSNGDRGVATPTHNAQATRDSLIAAAAALFEERGYGGATLRLIGARASVDPALVARYFGGKEGLYLATINRPDTMEFAGDPADALAQMLSQPEDRVVSPVRRAVVSPMPNDAVLQAVSDALNRRIVEPLEQTFASAEDTRLRAELLIAIGAGISLSRQSGTLPTLAGAPLERIVDLVQPLVAQLAGPGD